MKKVLRQFFLSALFTAYFFTETYAQKPGVLTGKVLTSAGKPLIFSKLDFFDFNKDTKVYSHAGQTISDSTGKFIFRKEGAFAIRAYPNTSFNNELPTVYGHKLFMQFGDLATVNKGDSLAIEIQTLAKKELKTGAGALGGAVTLGKTAEPASGMMVFLIDADSNVVNYTKCDSLGNWNFNGLALNTYYVWIDYLGIDTAVVPPIELTDVNPKKLNIHFQVIDEYAEWIENNFTNLADALAHKDDVYRLELNSLQHDKAEKTLVINEESSRRLKGEIGQFKNLEYLSLDINQLSSFPEEIGELQKLQYLSADLNSLSTLPESFSRLKKLKTLHLGRNKFENFPTQITGLSDLENLILHMNKFQSIPAEIKNLKKLRKLDLSKSFNLTELPKEIGELSSLEELDLSRCVKMKSLPEELNKLSQLKILDISGTKINAKSFQKAVPNCQIKEE